MKHSHSPSIATAAAPPISILWLAVGLSALILVCPLTARAADVPNHSTSLITLRTSPAAASPLPDQSPEVVGLRAASSPAEKKLSFNLFLVSRKARKAPVSPIDSMLAANVLNPDGTVDVEIHAYLSPSLLSSSMIRKIIADNGGSIPVSAYESDHLLVRIHPDQLLDIAANANVFSIQEPAAHGAPNVTASAAH